jgi:ATP adenylyltransferase
MARRNPDTSLQPDRADGFERIWAPWRSAYLTAAEKRSKRCYKPTGINVGANLGRAAGASFADHMHWHLVPRWEGDTNFMTVLVSTRVLSQPLAETYALLEPLFKAIDPAAI